MSRPPTLTLPKQLVIFDLDGVVYRGQTPTPDAAAVITRLQASGFDVHFLTNNSSQHRNSYCAKLGGLGIHAAQASIMTSAYATALYLTDEGLKGASVLVVGEAGLAEELNDAGIRALPAGPHYAEESVAAVVVGIDREFTYLKLEQAQGALLAGARFIATNRDPTFPTEGRDLPGGGSIVAAIATASGREPFTVGKPNTLGLELILKATGVPKPGVVLVGDRLDTDIDVGIAAGIDTILTLTGVTKRSDLKGLPANRQPTAVIEDLRGLAAALRG